MSEKREFFQLMKFLVDSLPLSDETQCVEVIIPSGLEWVYALQGLVSALTRDFNFQGDREQATALAYSANVAYVLTDWEGCMSCQDIADCIYTDAVVQQAINDVYSLTSPATPIPDAMKQSNIAPPNPTCDLDNLFGQIDNLIEQMNVNNLDFQQIIESQSNASERIAQLFSAIPIIETLPVDEVIDFGQDIWSNALFEAYEANDTTAYRDTLKCDLFCISQLNSCALSLDDVTAYFADRLGATTEDTLQEVVDFLLLGTWTGTEVNDVFYYMQSVMLAFGNKFFDLLGLKPFEIYLALGESNGDWALLCSACSVFALDIFSDLGGTTLVETREITLGTEFDIVVSPASFPSGEALIRKNGVPVNVRMTYTASGTIAATVAETAWYYLDTLGVPQSEVPGILTNMPSPADGSEFFWNNQEALDGIATYTLHVTLDVIP